MKGEVYWREPRAWRLEGNIVGGCGGAQVHNAEVVGHYVSMNFYVTGWPNLPLI